MEIKVLGSGCANCKKLYENVSKAVSEMGLDAQVLYVTDLKAIAQSGLMRTPGVVVDNVIVTYGRVLTIEETKKLIENFDRLRARKL
ncbi:thioredoxin family protein [Acholeplasma vituli]|uniref:Thioredoxin family protein n=1 Tax=Paracholeplasma vituli TaxID=69473 RepID=A0ABT2PWC7_9MOLU|nr:thioredoxin family protein [Paracholeplasma vituli]MCU0105266.1 thioredoxin family protein [Paracholeplasma vituli]